MELGEAEQRHLRHCKAVKAQQWSDPIKHDQFVVFLTLEERDMLNIWGPFNKYERGVTSPDFDVFNSGSPTKCTFLEHSRGSVTILAHDCVHGGETFATSLPRYLAIPLPALLLPTDE